MLDKSRLEDNRSYLSFMKDTLCFVDEPEREEPSDRQLSLLRCDWKHFVMLVTK
jgi:hypothetical protein